MRCFLARCRGFLFGAFIALSLLTGFAGSSVDYDPQATFRTIFNDERLRLTASYCLTHYGSESAELREPQLIVVHYTAFATRDEAFRFFAPPRLDRVSRRDMVAARSTSRPITWSTVTARSCSWRRTTWSAGTPSASTIPPSGSRTWDETPPS